ncbi:MAG TPA: Fur family transcriptional regulator [Acidiphilium sp.]|nr:Fur family transcriptional regulator [Acidiphilium sp.]
MGWSMAGQIGVQARLEAAASLCMRRGQRFTLLRRAVFELVLTAGGPVTAYELLERLRAGHQGATPATVYRALEFLLAARLVHKVESLSAFIPCVDDEQHDHAAQFFICARCGAVAEIEDRSMAQALAQAAERLGFRVTASMVEVSGVCADCAAG